MPNDINMNEQSIKSLKSASTKLTTKQKIQMEINNVSEKIRNLEKMIDSLNKSIPIMIYDIQCKIKELKGQKNNKFKNAFLNFFSIGFYNKNKKIENQIKALKVSFSEKQEKINKEKNDLNQLIAENKDNKIDLLNKLLNVNDQINKNKDKYVLLLTQIIQNLKKQYKNRIDYGIIPEIDEKAIAEYEKVIAEYEIKFFEFEKK